MDSTTLIAETLEQLASKCDDITCAVYDRFERSCPEGAALLAPTTAVVRGRMLGEILDAIGARGEREKLTDIYIAGEAVTHAPMNIGFPVYEALFAALFETIDEILGDDWSPEAKRAWSIHTNGILAAVRQGMSRGCPFMSSAAT